MKGVSIRRIAPLPPQGRDVWPYCAPPPGAAAHDTRRELIARQREHARAAGGRR
jgi:hypothetical protein